MRIADQQAITPGLCRRRDREWQGHRFSGSEFGTFRPTIDTNHDGIFRIHPVVAQPDGRGRAAPGILGPVPDHDFHLPLFAGPQARRYTLSGGLQGGWIVTPGYPSDGLSFGQTELLTQPLGQHIDVTIFEEFAMLHWNFPNTIAMKIPLPTHGWISIAQEGIALVTLPAV